MRRGIIFGLLAVVIAGVSFGAGALVDRWLLSVTRSDPVAPIPQNPASVNQRLQPSKEEVLAYLDGKTIHPPGADKSEITLKKEQIRALEVETSSSRAGNEPWSTAVRFVVTTDQGRYAVEIWVRHNTVENERVIYGFDVKRLDKL